MESDFPKVTVILDVKEGEGMRKEEPIYLRHGEARRRGERGSQEQQHGELVLSGVRIAMSLTWFVVGRDPVSQSLARLAPKAVGSSLSRACHPRNAGEGTRLTLDRPDRVKVGRAESQLPGAQCCTSMMTPAPCLIPPPVRSVTTAIIPDINIRTVFFRDALRRRPLCSCQWT